MTQRYEKEIEEILKKAGKPKSTPSEQQPKPTEERPSASPGHRVPPSRRGSRISRLSVNYKYALLAGTGALIISIFIGGLPLLLIGAALLVVGYVMYYRGPRSGGGSNGGRGGGRPQKMWRGRVIDPGDDPHFTEDPWGRRR